MYGTIKRVIRDRGFGFIAAEDGREYFFHRTGLDSSVNFDSLAGGERVSFEIEPSQNRHASGSILIRAFRQLDLAARNVEEERLALVRAQKRHSDPAAQARILVHAVIRRVLLHRQERVGVLLRQVYVCHSSSLPVPPTPW